MGKHISLEKRNASSICKGKYFFFWRKMGRNEECPQRSKIAGKFAL